MNSKFNTKKALDTLKKNKVYIAIAVCIILAGVFSWIGVNKALTDVQQSREQLEEKINQPVDDNKDDVPKSSQQGNGSSSSDSDSSTSKDSEASSKKQNKSQTSPSSTYIWPVNGDVKVGFSNGELVKSKTLGDWRTHNGIDIAAKEGTQVKAVNNGTVTNVYESPMWGTVVEIKISDTISCLYANLNANVKVKKGQTVKQGDIIGTVGKTAAAEIGEDDHLHFEMLKNKKYVDPISYFGDKS